jgi:hypothetical protein
MLGAQVHLLLFGGRVACRQQARLGLPRSDADASGAELAVAGDGDERPVVVREGHADDLVRLTGVGVAQLAGLGLSENLEPGGNGFEATRRRAVRPRLVSQSWCSAPS